MKTKFEKNSFEWYMFQDFWRITQEFWIVEDNEKYWEQLIKNLTVFGDKYNHDKFALSLAYALIDELNRKAEKLRKEQLGKE